MAEEAANLTIDEVPMGKRVFVDANVLLHAAFIEDSIARRSLRGLRLAGYSAVTDEIVHHESVRRLIALRQKLGLRYRPEKIFEREQAELKLLHVPPGDTQITTLVPRHDRHVMRAATELDAWVLTDDLELQILLLSEGIHARNSHQVLMGLPQKVQYLSELQTLPARHPPPFQQDCEGWIMAWVTPQGWPESDDPRRHTVMDAIGFGCLYYDNAQKRWAMTLDAGVSLTCQHMLETDRIEAVAFSFDSRRTPTQLSLYCGTSIGTSRAATHDKNAMEITPPVMPLGFSIGSSRDTSDHWGGYVRSLSVGDRFLGKSTWKKLITIQGLLPHPEQNILQRALFAIAQRPISDLGLPRILEI